MADTPVEPPHRASCHRQYHERAVEIEQLPKPFGDGVPVARATPKQRDRGLYKHSVRIVAGPAWQQDVAWRLACHEGLTTECSPLGRRLVPHVRLDKEGKVEGAVRHEREVPTDPCLLPQVHVQLLRRLHEEVRKARVLAMPAAGLLELQPSAHIHRAKQLPPPVLGTWHGADAECGWQVEDTDDDEDN